MEKQEQEFAEVLCLLKPTQLAYKKKPLFMYVLSPLPVLSFDEGSSEVQSQIQ